MKKYLQFLAKTPLYTLIEGIGLTLALALVILIGNSILDQHAILHGFPTWQDAYLVGYTGMGNGINQYRDKETLSQIPEFEALSVYRAEDMYVIKDEEALNTTVDCVDPEFFDIFPFKVKEGSLPGFDSPEAVILTTSGSKRLFPKGNPIGQSLTVCRKPEGETVLGFVIAVVEDPVHSIFQDCDFFLPFTSPLMKDVRESDMGRNGWGQIVNVFGRLAPTADPDQVSYKIRQAFVTEEKLTDANIPVLKRYDKIFFSNGGYRLRHGNPAFLLILVAIGLLLLVSAIINYLNINFALSLDRAREMATRRLMGADTRRLIFQRILETLLFVAFCYLVALPVARAIAPMLNSVVRNGMTPVPFHVGGSATFVAFSVLLVLLTGLAAGISPAIFVSSFRPIDIISGRFRRMRKQAFNKVSVVFQAVLAIVFISLTLIFLAQIRHLEKVDVGTDVENLYFLTTRYVGDGTELAPLEDVIRTSPHVKRIGHAEGFPSNVTITMSGAKKENKDQVLYIQTIYCDSAAFKIFGFNIEEDFRTPMSNSFWISRRGANATGVSREDPDMGKVLWNPEEFHLGGIVSDFRAFPPSAEINPKTIPAIIVLPDEIALHTGGLIVETDSDHESFSRFASEAKEDFLREKLGFTIGENSRSSFTGYIKDYLRQDTTYLRSMTSLCEVLSIVAILILLLGLVAMSSIFSRVQTKRIAIQKVFGGTIASETRRNICSFIILILIGIAVAVPVAVFIGGNLLKSFAERASGTWWIFVVASLLTLVFAIGSVLWQTLRAAKTDPATELKKE